MRSIYSTLLIVLLTISHAPPRGDLIFSDAFEGNATACAAGQAVPDARGGALGQAPPGEYELLGCFEVMNAASIDRVSAIASGGLPMVRDWQIQDASLDQFVVVGPGGQRLAAQFEIVSRWGGPVSDLSRPVRWLEVIVPATVEAGDSVRYELRRYDQPVAGVGSEDDFAIEVDADGDGYLIDTGLATWRIDPDNPALVDWMDADPDNDGSGPRQRVLTDRPGAGPRLTVNTAAPVTLSTDLANSVFVDAFEFDHIGPVRTRAVMVGHFAAPGGATLCTTAGVPDYEPFGFTLTATWTRGSRDLELEWIVRNECSDAFSPPWTDEAVTWLDSEWRVPLDDASGPRFAAAGGPVRSVGIAVNETVAEQRKGAFDGGSWQRRAELRLDGQVGETAATFDSPVVGAENGNFVATVQMPWMRFREPQALVVRPGNLAAQPVSTNLTVGEGKGLWSRMRIQVRPSGGNALARIETMRDLGRLSLEQPLVPRWPLAEFNASGIMPELAAGTGSAVEEAYRRYMMVNHDNTVRDGPTGQWTRFKTYGSQLWPDTQAADLFAFPDPSVTEPATNSGAMNYWNPSGAELLEFLRTGEPRWIWDFAQPQAWLQLFTARMNIGARSHGARNGVAVTSDGTGEGQWHRSGGGSDDYNYNAGMHLHYAVQPTPAMRARLRHGGQMLLDRYSVPWNPADPGNTSNPNQLATQTDRDVFFNAVMPVRGNFQHFELLANCAEFVRGSVGAACDQRLGEIMDELANDNLRAGLICQDDVPVDDVCDLPQTFMTNAMMYHFLLRYYLNYGDVQNLAGEATLSRTLGELMVHFYEQGMDQRPSGGPDSAGDWAYALGCDLTDGATQVATCTRRNTGDGLAMFGANKPHTVALGLIGTQLDPSAGLCQTSRRLFDELFANLDPATNPYGPLADFADGTGGWWKGSNQAAQMLVYAVGGYQGCADP